MENFQKLNNKNLSLIKKYFESNIVYQEHLSRYYFAKPFVKDKVVLDLGCSIGDGTYILSESAYRIIGIDIDKEAIQYAKHYYSSSKIEYIEGDGRLLHFKDEYFDVIVSLEVIEHLMEQESFLSEIRRLLKKGGTALISTPNKEIIKIEGSGSNPSHIKELTFAEFKLLLNRYFSSVEFYGQRRGRGVVGFGGFLHHCVCKFDFLKLRKLFLQKHRNYIFEKVAKISGAKDVSNISTDDIVISKRRVASARTIISVCRK